MRYRGQWPEGRFGTLVADPPWRTRIGGTRRKYPYDVMDFEDLVAMAPMIDEHTLPGAHLWLWTTNPLLLDGTSLRLCGLWNFIPRALLTWDKRMMGLGWWLRGKTEHCIWATRPGKTTGRIHRQTGLTTLLSETRRKHSQKPEGFYKYPETLSPGPYLELFARSTRPGWTSVETHSAPANPYLPWKVAK